MDISIEALREAIGIRRQIDALEKRLSAILGASAPELPKKVAPFTPAGRRKLSQLTKARWAARKKAAGKKLTPAGRRKLSQLMKARWARLHGVSDTRPPPPHRRS